MKLLVLYVMNGLLVTFFFTLYQLLTCDPLHRTAAGDTMGGCSVTPNGYSVLMKKLMPFARGRIMMALEGGYNFRIFVEFCPCLCGSLTREQTYNWIY